MIDVLLKFLLGLSLVIIAVCDVKYRIIPNKILLFLVAFRVALFLVIRDFALLKLTEIIFVAIVVMLIYIVANRKIGAGDIKLIIVISLYLTIKEFLYSMFVSMVIMLLGGIVLLCTKKVSRKSLVPLSPFVSIGTIIVMCVV